MHKLREVLSCVEIDVIADKRMIAVTHECTIGSTADLQTVSRLVDQVEALLARKYPRASKDAELITLLAGIRDEIPPFGPAELN